MCADRPDRTLDYWYAHGTDVALKGVPLRLSEGVRRSRVVVAASCVLRAKHGAPPPYDEGVVDAWTRKVIDTCIEEPHIPPWIEDSTLAQECRAREMLVFLLDAGSEWDAVYKCLQRSVACHLQTLGKEVGQSTQAARTRVTFGRLVVIDRGLPAQTEAFQWDLAQERVVRRVMVESPSAARRVAMHHLALRHLVAQQGGRREYALIDVRGLGLNETTMLLYALVLNCASREDAPRGQLMPDVVVRAGRACFVDVVQLRESMRNILVKEVSGHADRLAAAVYLSRLAFHAGTRGNNGRDLLEHMLKVTREHQLKIDAFERHPRRPLGEDITAWKVDGSGISRHAHLSCTCHESHETHRRGSPCPWLDEKPIRDLEPSPMHDVDAWHATGELSDLAIGWASLASSANPLIRSVDWSAHLSGSSIVALSISADTSASTSTPHPH